MRTNVKWHLLLLDTERISINLCCYHLKMDGKSDRKNSAFPAHHAQIQYTFSFPSSRVYTATNHPIHTRLIHLTHILAPGTLLELLLLPHLPLLLSLQPNRRRILINTHLLPARGLNTGGETGAGWKLEAGTKTAPHLPVFAALKPTACGVQSWSQAGARCISHHPAAVALKNSTPSVALICYQIMPLTRTVRETMNYSNSDKSLMKF